MHMFRKSSAGIFSSIFFSFILAAEDARFWEPYQPGEKTLALFHFDQNLDDSSSAKNEAVLSGAAELVPKGKFGGALKLSGGGLDITRKNSPSSYVLEFWLKPEKLPVPGKMAVLLDRSFKENEQHWQQLLLCSDGSMIWKNSRRTAKGGGGDYFLLAKPGAVKPGEWQHIAFLHNAPGEYSELVFLNGKSVTGTACGWRNLPDEPSSGKIRIGSRQSQAENKESWERVPDDILEKIKYHGEDEFVPFQGLIDELRIIDGSIAFVPQPDESFLDPMKKRALPAGNTSLPSEGDILFYASFDQNADADKAGGNPKSSRLKQAVLVPGVRGQSLSLPPASDNTVIWESKNNFNASAGTVSYWFRPHTPFVWSTSGSFISQRLYFTPFILIGNTYHFHAPLYPTQELFPPWQWVYLTWTWNKDVAIFYVNGKRAYDIPMKHDFVAHPEDGMQLTAGIPAEYDELKIYRRPLSPVEIQNEYMQYFEKRKMNECGNAGSMLVDLRGINKLIGSVFSRVGEIPQAKEIGIELRRGEGLKGKIAAKISLPFQGRDDTPFQWELPADVQAGDYSLKIDFKDAAGKTICSGNQSLHRKDYPWLGAGKNEEERVLKPFTPIEYAKPVVKIVGRELQLNKSGLFDQIKCWGDDLLAAPMRFELMDAKGAVEVKGQEVNVALQKPVRISWNSSSRAIFGEDQELEIKVDALMDYDGGTKFTVTYSPLKNPVTIKNFTLVVPLAARHAQLFNWNVGAWPGLLKPEERIEVALPWETRFRQGEGEIFSSMLTYRGAWKDNIVRENVTYRLPTLGNYMPQVWFGSNDRGISIYGDNDRGWVPHNDYPAIQVIRKGKEASIRLNFIPSEYRLDKPRTIVFGFLATPVKPIPPDWRTKQYVGEFGVPFGSGSAYLADYEDRRQDLPALKSTVDMRHKNGEYCMPHINASFWELGNVTRSEFSTEWHDAWNYAPYTMMPQSKTDYIVWTVKQLKKDLGIDGFYFDCAQTCPNFNTVSGTAYQLDDGQVQPGWTIFSEREMFKRVSHVFGDIYTENHFWGNGFYGPELSGWQAATVVGEGCEVYTKDNKELVGRHHVGHGDYWTFFPVEYYSDTLTGQFAMERIHAVSQQWGMIRLWQGPNYMWHMSKPESDTPELVEKVKKFSRSATGQLIILDAKYELQANKFPQYYRDFVAKPELKNMPFWNNADKISHRPGQDKEIYASAFVSGKEMLLLISNLSKTKQKVSLTVDCASAGIDSKNEAIDAEKDATWGTTVADTYWKHICDGRPLLSDEEMKFNFKQEGAKAKLDITVGGKDFRALIIKGQ